MGPAPRRVKRMMWRRLLFAAIALGIIAASLALDSEAAWGVPILFVLVVPFEKLFPRHRQKLRRSQLWTDIGYALAAPALQGIGLLAGFVVAVVSLAWIPGLLLRPLVAMIPAGMLPFVGIALFDLAIYWTHRWYHEVPFLWRFHAIHHSPEHMDWISGFRNHPLDGTLIAPAFIFLLAAGFDAEFTGVLAIVQIVLGIFLHANVRWRFRWFHKIVITPEFHHWHHANEPGAINSNYSVFLPAWDLVFGTYFMPKDRRPQVYGVTEHVPAGMVAQLWHPLRGVGNPLRIIVHPVRSLVELWRGTGQLLRDIKRSTLRPRRRSHDDLAAWTASASGARPKKIAVSLPANPQPPPPTGLAVARRTEPMPTDLVPTRLVEGPWSPTRVMEASERSASAVELGSFPPDHSQLVGKPRSLADVMGWSDESQRR